MADDDLASDLDAAGLRVDHADIAVYVQTLAHKLELALPSQTVVERRSNKLLSREKVVESIAVLMGDHRYVLSGHGHRVQAGRGRRCAA